MICSTERIPKLNVSREADRDFMAELKKTDRERYDRLIKAMQVHAARLQRVVPEVIEMPAPKCEHCGLKLPPDKREDGRYCDRNCKQAAYRLRTAGELA